MSEEVRLDDNEIRISGAPRTEVTVSGCNRTARQGCRRALCLDHRAAQGGLVGRAYALEQARWHCHVASGLAVSDLQP